MRKTGDEDVEGIEQRNQPSLSAISFFLFFFFAITLTVGRRWEKNIVKVCFVCNNSVHSALSGLVGAGFSGWAEGGWGGVRRGKFSDIDPPLSSLWLFEELSFRWSPCAEPLCGAPVRSHSLLVPLWVWVESAVRSARLGTSDPRYSDLSASKSVFLARWCR